MIYNDIQNGGLLHTIIARYYQIYILKELWIKYKNYTLVIYVYNKNLKKY